MSLLRTLGLYVSFWRYKFKYRRHVRFNGFTAIYSFPGSSIEFAPLGDGPDAEPTVINSHWTSNLLGLYQRSILVARHGGRIRIGRGCGISGSTLYAMSEIVLGDDVRLGANCKVIDNDFHAIEPDRRREGRVEDIPRRPIRIGDGCFIGTNCILLKGTTLGRNCVVGAGSVVTGTWPDNSVIAGNPARLIRKIE
ncbi:MAG: acyltransferase [Bacteroidaceae bacterium]|nr:acyltransferase [Bacteroidaceae bacterium]